jgi:hypothetical protein
MIMNVERNAMQSCKTSAGGSCCGKLRYLRTSGWSMEHRRRVLWRISCPKEAITKQATPRAGRRGALTMNSVVKKKGRNSVRSTVSGWLRVRTGIAESAQQVEFPFSKVVPIERYQVGH